MLFSFGFRLTEGGCAGVEGFIFAFRDEFEQQ